jgi:polysaccharide deacetylase family protein (PEP-CTERM system associated)
LIFEIGPERFKADLRRSRLLLEDLGGRKIKGYRAPSFSITDRSMWALDILLEEGFVYDSSMFPIRHDVYGTPDIDPFPHRIKRDAGTLWEFPMTTFAARFLGSARRIPVSGGGYLRLLPVGLVRRAFLRINLSDRQPCVLYFHPWEVDPEQPRIAAPLRSRLRHYLNLGRTQDKVSHLLQSLAFAPMAEVLGV